MGLYQKARSGNLSNLSGIGSEYEPPVHAELTIDTSQESVNQAIEKILPLI